MGNFRVVVEAAGGHGCNRTAKEGEEARGCGGETCPDCITARYIAALKQAGMHPTLALYTHWPEAMSRHEFFVRTDGTCVCLRCGTEFGNYVTGLGEAPKNPQCPAGVGYPADREVVDDLTERKIKYPHILRVTPVRVKGQF
jgi:hypothetical protein